MATFDLFYEFRGQTCNIMGDIEPADESVGIMGIGISCFQIFLNGKELQLTPAEEDAVFADEKLLERISEQYHR